MDRTGSYNYAYMLFVGLSAAAALAELFADRFGESQ